MKTEQFNDIIESQQKRCTDILITKAKEYATEDRLHNFKVAAKLQMTTPINALAGMLAKHIPKRCGMKKSPTISTTCFCLKL